MIRTRIDSRHSNGFFSLNVPVGFRRADFSRHQQPIYTTTNESCMGGNHRVAVTNLPAHVTNAESGVEDRSLTRHGAVHTIESRQDVSVESHCLVRGDGLRRTLLVASIRVRLAIYGYDATCPGKANEPVRRYVLSLVIRKDRRFVLIPVFVSPLREEQVFVGGVGDVSNQQQHVLVILPAPLGIVLGHHRGSVDVVAEMEMVVVVETCAKVLSGVGKGGAVGVRVPAAAMAVLVVVVAAAHHHTYSSIQSHCIFRLEDDSTLLTNLPNRYRTAGETLLSR